MQTVESELQTQLFLAKSEKPRCGVIALGYDDTLAPFREKRNAACSYRGACQSPSPIWAGGRTRVELIHGRPAEELKSLADSWVKLPPELLECFHEWFQRSGGAG
jgi:hypothetical protein